MTYSTARGTYQIYQESEMDKLGEELMRADLVVGWNHVHFDYEVLQPYFFHTLVEETINLDIMLELVVLLGFPVEFDSIALANLGIKVTHTELDALRLWGIHRKTGGIQPLHELADYCTQEVKIIKSIYQSAIENGLLKYYKMRDKLAEVLVDWRNGFGPRNQAINGINDLRSLCAYLGRAYLKFDCTGLNGVPCKVSNRMGDVMGIIDTFGPSIVNVNFPNGYISQTTGSRENSAPIRIGEVTAQLNAYQIAYIISTVKEIPIKNWPCDEERGFIYPPESFVDNDNDCDFDYEEADREREQLIADSASDSDDFSRSDEEGWYYPDQQDQ